MINEVVQNSPTSAEEINSEIKGNTKIGYLYRDASNYKKWNEVIVNGAITKEQIQSIIECLDGEEFFIPCQVGLPEKRFNEWTEDDHCWFELDETNFVLTEQDATIDMGVEELVELFLQVKGKWDHEKYGEENEYDGE